MMDQEPKYTIQIKEGKNTIDVEWHLAVFKELHAQTKMIKSIKDNLTILVILVLFVIAVQLFAACGSAIGL